MKLTQLALLAALALVPTTLLAQATTFPTTSTPPTTTTPPTTKPGQATGKSIAERRTDQPNRLAQGVKSGQLTAGETSKLEQQEAGINKEESGMREQDNGKLTKADKKHLTGQQNQESRRIFSDKHNAAKR